MSYSIIKKYNWTRFAEKILNALTGTKQTFMRDVATSTTLNLKTAFRTVSIMNTHATAAITISNEAGQTVSLPALTTMNFDAINGSIMGGDITVVTGSGTAIIAGIY